MARRIKTSFTAGELAPELFGRSDLRAYENGARRLRNVVILPTGGLSRRPGLRHLAMLPGPARLISFEFNTEQTYLLAFTDGAMRVVQGDAEIATVPGPWTGAMLEQMAHTQNADTLLLLHPDMPPQRITRTGAATWTVAPFAFVRAPFHRFADPGVTLAASATTGSVTLTASAPVFQPGHAGVRFRQGGRRVLVTAIGSATSATATVEETLAATDPTTDWDEAAISPLRGWPVSACFHQDRLVLGGTRELPNRLFLSRSGLLDDFDLGTGLDDQGIEFALLSDQVNAIRAVFSGRHLQVFTSGAEWMVTGDPLTPSSIQLLRQTRIGSPVDRMVPPVDVDGATIFVARSGRAVHEFAYTDVADTYQSNDLGLIARHLIERPVAMAYDQPRRLLHIAMASGRMATLTLYRAEAVTAWCAQETAGAVRSLAEVDGTVYAAVERFGTHRLERFDEALGLDAALSGEQASAQAVWSALGHLEGRRVGIIADGAPQGDQTVLAGAVTLDDPAREVQVGLRFTHVIEPLPIELGGGAFGTRAAPLRLVSVTFRVLETVALSVDLGRGAFPVPFRRLDTPLLDAPPPRFSGDVSLRGLGWRRDALSPLWRIEDDAALPLTLLSVTTETRTTP
jgi:hypothetical protein